MISRNNRTAVLTLASLTVCGSLLVTAALAKPPKKKPATSSAAAITAGKKVYDANMCAGCHAINGKGGTSGPDLSATGAESEHTVKWLAAQVSDPKSHKPDSSMPGYADKIKGKDLTNVATYLASLKKK